MTSLFPTYPSFCNNLQRKIYLTGQASTSTSDQLCTHAYSNMKYISFRNPTPVVYDHIYNLKNSHAYQGVSCQFLLTAWISIILATNLRSTFGANISWFYAFGRFTIILPTKISANYQELAIESRHKSILVQGAIEVYLQEQNCRFYLFSTKPSLFTINYFYYQPTYIITTISH